MTTRAELADILFPDITETVESLLQKYPERAGNPTVTRFAPSPTGFLHLWGLFSAFISRKYANQKSGLTFLRIEDTDQKREVEGATELLILALKKFGITFAEWPIGENGQEIWNYWPYTQSHRADIYRVFAKKLVAEGLAYPCRMTEEELNATREMQMAAKIIPGIYWKYSQRRDKTPDQLLEKFNQENQTFPVLRFRSPGDTSKKIVFEDLIRGKIAMIDNYNDIVIIKGDGLPTYHFAHLVDDTLMRTTTVSRGEEWLTSVPLHLQLFAAFGFKAPEYAHFSAICKLEDWKKRKLSKRKDPEANVEYFFQEGYAPEAVLQYLLTLADSSYEDWQKENPDSSFLDFQFSLEKMNVAGPLFDFVKIQNINNNYLSLLSTAELYAQGLGRAEKYSPALADLMKKYPDYTQQALNIERHTEKDPKRFTLYTDISKNILFFYDEERENLKTQKPDFPENILHETRKAFAQEYAENFDLSWDVLTWFDQLKEIWKKYGFAANNAEFKQWGFIWKVWDLAMFLRIQLCWAKQTPDLFSVMKVMGRERVVLRLTDI